MKRQRRFILIFSVVFLFVYTTNVWCKALELAKRPEDLGFSSERLTRIDKALQAQIEKGDHSWCDHPYWTPW